MQYYISKSSEGISILKKPNNWKTKSLNWRKYLIYNKLAIGHPDFSKCMPCIPGQFDCIETLQHPLENASL